MGVANIGNGFFNGDYPFLIVIRNFLLENGGLIFIWRIWEMELQQLEKALQVRYIKLHFGLCLLEDTMLPKNKVSAIRGGIGEMLLQANCIRDRNCEKCDFAGECIVRRTMYSQFEEKPDFITSGESVGYVLECENYEEEFREGEILNFQLLLFGKTIVYFSQFVQAIYQLGTVGIGRNHSCYEIAYIRNTLGKDILRENNICMEQYKVLTLWDYVGYRLRQNQKWENRIRFKTPVTLKYQGEFQQNLSAQAVVPAVFRRIYIMDCFEGLKCEMLGWDAPLPEVLQEYSYPIFVYRYSSTQNKKMPLKGIRGEMQLSRIPEKLLPILLAGEVLHIGKNTSFGFGRYHVF